MPNLKGNLLVLGVCEFAESRISRDLFVCPKSEAIWGNAASWLNTSSLHDGKAWACTSPDSSQVTDVPGIGYTQFVVCWVLAHGRNLKNISSVPGPEPHISPYHYSVLQLKISNLKWLEKYGNRLLGGIDGPRGGDLLWREVGDALCSVIEKRSVLNGHFMGWGFFFFFLQIYTISV